ncbi:unnamed protein product [Blepharisma stoltei]|uniref:Uncharacterized protein n=1 Tax=Blepharisma stoltei TaxID=1481888 RepID=A0AAU9IJK7_9CILI|nr:unnamed protein product [Blepharisma stoltei]
MEKFRDWSRTLGILVGLAAVILEFKEIGFKVLIYLTIWTLIINTSSLLILKLDLGSQNLQQALVIVSWILGFNVSLLFWLYVYPMIGDSVKLPPVWHLSLDHGILLLFFIPEALNPKISFNFRDFFKAIYVMLAYLLVVMVPCALKGIVIYPGLSFNNSFTLIIVGVNIGTVVSGYYIGKYLNEGYSGKKAIKIQ